MKLKVVLLFVLFLSSNVVFSSALVDSYNRPRNSAIVSQGSAFSYENNRSYLSKADMQAIIKSLKNKLSQNPNNVLLYTSLIEAELSLGQTIDAYNDSVELYKTVKKNGINYKETDAIRQLRLAIQKKYPKTTIPSSVCSVISNLSLSLDDFNVAEQYILGASKNIRNEDVFVDSLEHYISAKQDAENTLKLLNSISSTTTNKNVARLKAETLLQMGNKNDAISAYKKILELNPNEDDVIISLYRLLDEKGQKEKDIISNMFGKDTESAQKGYQKLSELLLERGDLQEASNFISQFANQYPNNPDALVLVSEIQRRQGDIESAYSTLEQVRNKADNNETISKYNVQLAKLADNPLEQANSLMNNGLYAQALELLQGSNQDALYVILGMARANYYLDNKQVSFELLNKAMSLYPNNADVFYYFAYIFYAENDLDSANKYLKKVFDINPNHAYGKALQDEVNNASANRYMSQISSNFEMQNYDETMRLVDEALSINPKGSNLYLYKGLTYMAKNEYERATAPLYKAISLDNNNVYAYFFLAQAFDNLSEAQNALEYYKKFISKVSTEDYEASEKIDYAKSRIEKLQ